MLGRRQGHRARRLIIPLALACVGASGSPLPADAALPPLRVADGKMRDPAGRAVLLRGANFPAGLRVPSVVERPAEDVRDHAKTMATLGFNLARVQLAWGAMEPGTLPPNHPSICTPGAPRDPGQWDAAHAQRYLDRVEAVVRMLADHGIYTLFQIAQFGYNEGFGGPPSHPAWAVCTDGVPITADVPPNAYAQPGLGIAAQHFWENDVVGDLQGEYARMLGALAQRFAGDPSVAGLELYNEPFALPAALPDGRFDELLHCFYLGRTAPGALRDGRRPSCPAGVPEVGVIRTVRAIDPTRILHPQAHIFTNFGLPTQLGRLGDDQVVFNFHVYCPSEVLARRQRGPECESTERTAVEDAQRSRAAIAPDRAAPVPALLSEFGFTDNLQTIRHMTTLADEHGLGWAYFTWRNDDGPDNAGVLREKGGALRPKVDLLARPYPTALAGTLTTLRFDPVTAVLELRYRPDPRPTAQTVVRLPSRVYGERGACPAVSSGRWMLRGDRVVVSGVGGNDEVVVRVAPGRCGTRSQACLSRRLIMIRAPRGRRAIRVVSGRAYARVVRRGGRLLVRVDLRGRPPGRYRVAYTVDGRRMTRAFRTCSRRWPGAFRPATPHLDRSDPDWTGQIDPRPPREDGSSQVGRETPRAWWR